MHLPAGIPFVQCCCGLSTGAHASRAALGSQEPSLLLFSGLVQCSEVWLASASVSLAFPHHGGDVSLGQILCHAMPVAEQGISFCCRVG